MVNAEKNGDLVPFSAAITCSLEPLYSRVYDNAESIVVYSEIEQVACYASILKETADRLVPCFEPIGGSRSGDMAWKAAGCPVEGPLFDEKSRLQSAVRKRAR